MRRADAKSGRCLPVTIVSRRCWPDSAAARRWSHRSRLRRHCRLQARRGLLTGLAVPATGLTGAPRDIAAGDGVHARHRPGETRPLELALDVSPFTETVTVTVTRTERDRSTVPNAAW